MMRLLFGSRRHLPIGHIGAPLAEQIEIIGFLFCPVDMGLPLSRVLLLSRNSGNWCRIEVSAHTENLSCRGQVLGLVRPRSSIMLDIITFTLGCPLVFHGGLQYLIGVSPGPFGHILVFGFSWSEVDQPKEPVIYKILYRLLVEVQTYPLRIADNHLRSDDTEP